MLAATEETAECLPKLERFNLQPPSETDGLALEFRILYRGALPAQSKGNSRSKVKQAIRSALHPQLKELWNQHPWMGNADALASNFARCGFRFLPVIQKSALSRKVTK